MFYVISAINIQIHPRILLVYHVYRTLFNYSSKFKMIIWCLFTSTFGCNDSHVRTSSINKRVDYYVKEGINGLLLMEHQFYSFIISDRTKTNVWTISWIQWTFLDNIPFRLDRKKLIQFNHIAALSSCFCFASKIATIFLNPFLAAILRNVSSAQFQKLISAPLSRRIWTIFSRPSTTAWYKGVPAPPIKLMSAPLLINSMTTSSWPLKYWNIYWCFSDFNTMFP